MRRFNSISSSASGSTALATLLAALVLLPLLGHKPLTDWDEGIYAEVSREMLSLGWIVPHWNFQPWFEKPPLTMWITAIFFKVFGVTSGGQELWARAGSALSGVAIAGLLHGWLAKREGLLTAWFSTVILLATFGFLHVCHVGETDVLLSLGCVMALIGLTEVDEGDFTGWYLFWTGFAIAAMGKGAAAIVVPIAAVIFAVIQRWGQARFGRPCWFGLALFLLLVLPWHLAMFHLFGNRFLAEYFGLHVLTRATQQIEGHATPWWYYGKVLLVSAPPFVLVYPFAIAETFRASPRLGLRTVISTEAQRRGATRSYNLRAFAIFALVVVGFFSFVETRLPHYIAPAYPALAVLTATYLNERLKPFLHPPRPAFFWAKLAFATTAICVAAILLTAPARKALHSATLADGTTLPDNKDSTALLRDAFRKPQPISGPLLVWRQARLSIATDVFYSRRPVQQVMLRPAPDWIPTNRYTFNPRPLSDAVTYEPQLILLDRALVAQIPSGLRYTPIESGKTVELGTIVRAR